MNEDRTQRLARLLDAQAAVDLVLSRDQQERERQADGSFRVRCCRCGTSVSNPLPVAVIVRAWVECPECAAREADR